MTELSCTRVRNVLLRTKVLVSLAALAVCLVVPAGLVRDEYQRTVAWGGAILASAVGWGMLVERRLYGDDARLGWGLEAALGLAVHLALGGLLAVLSLVSVTTSCVAVTLGVALFAFEACRRAAAEGAPPTSDSRKGTGPRDHRIAGGVVVLFFGLALLQYLWMATERPANIVDDFQAYFSFPKQLLATGTLIEPFSARRIFAYGGQSYLQALVLAFSTVFRIGVLDNGICVLVLAGLVVGWVRERPRFPLAVAVPALLGLFTLHYYDLNHSAASEFSGAVFFLAMFRVLDRPRRAGESAWANPLALALVAFAACTLRQSNLPAAALIPAAYYGLRMVREGNARRRWAQEAALAALFSLALLLPWMVLTYRSCGTALYPLIVGNASSQSLLSSGPPIPISAAEKAPYFPISAAEKAPYFPISAAEKAPYFPISAAEKARYFPISAAEKARYFPISAVEKARYFVMASLYPGRLPGLLLAFTAGLLVPSRASLALRASLAGTVLTIIMLFNTLASVQAIDATDRYLFPYGLAYFLAVSLIVAGAMAYPTMKPARSVIAMALVAGALVLPLVQRPDNIMNFYFGEVKDIEAERADPYRFHHEDPGDAVYAALQRAVPEHATLLVMLDQPFRLDFKRNRILLWDLTGGASPPPHLPIGQGPDALARYLLGQGVRYVAYCDGPDPNSVSDGEVQALSRLGQGVHYVAYCDRGLSPGHPVIRRPVIVDLEKLTATRKQLYADNGTYVLDLATPAPASP